MGRLLRSKNDCCYRILVSGWNCTVLVNTPEDECRHVPISPPLTPLNAITASQRMQRAWRSHKRIVGANRDITPISDNAGSHKDHRKGSQKIQLGGRPLAIRHTAVT